MPRDQSAACGKAWDIGLLKAVEEQRDGQIGCNVAFFALRYT
jgi:hypothetical protein